MLARRHIRIKVLQALYGFYRDDYADSVIALKNLNKSLERIYELYLYDIATLREIHKIAQERIALLKKKLRPTKEDLNPNMRFVNNQVLQLISDNVQLDNLIEEHHISWTEYKDHFKKLFTQIREDDVFFKYMNGPEPGLSGDKALIKYIYSKYVCNNEFIHQIYEDKYIHWADDLDAAQMMTTKTIKTFNEHSTAGHRLVKLFKDQADENFGTILFRKVISNNQEFEKLISEKTKNWETDRIAVIDNLLMKMALAEFTEFSDIPVKVTLNEYIELSKEYSTPKSGNFINGILDKMVIDLKAKNKIKKMGRGLL